MVPDPDKVLVGFHVDSSVDEGQQDGRQDEDGDENSGGEEVRSAKLLIHLSPDTRDIKPFFVGINNIEE